MKCKVFFARTTERLETMVNQWLETHAVSIEHTQFSTVEVEDNVEFHIFHTLVLFYVPRVGEA